MTLFSDKQQIPEAVVQAERFPSPVRGRRNTPSEKGEILQSVIDYLNDLFITPR